MGGEGDDRGGTAAGRRTGAGGEIIGALAAVAARLVDMAMSVDAAGRERLLARAKVHVAPLRGDDWIGDCLKLHLMRLHSVIIPK